MTNIPMTNKKFNCSKAFLLAAGFFASFAGTALADDYKFSSGTITNDGEKTFACDESNWGTDCKDIGLLFGLPESIYDSDKNAFLAWSEDTETYKDREYDSFNAIFWLSGNAQYTNEETGTITFSCADEDGHFSYTENSEEHIYTIGEDVVLISGEASFVNKGEVVFDYDNILLALAGSATFENASSGKISLGWLSMFGNAYFENKGNISVANTEIEIYNNGKLVNEGELSMSYMLYTHLSGNASFVNEGKLSSVDYGSLLLDFWSYEDGDASFVNKANGVISLEGFDVEFCFSSDSSLYGGVEKIPDTFTGTFENYGTITSTRELAASFGIEIYEDSMDAAKSIYENFDPTGKAFFKNYGTITAENVIINSPIETTLAQGSQIVGNLTLGNAAEYDIIIENYDSEFYSGTYVTEKSVLNIVLNGSSETPLISGNLMLLNTTELNVSVDPDSETAEIYTVTLWDGELVYGEQTIYSYDDGQYTEGETITGSFVETSGTFVVGDETFNWVLDTSTGILTATLENLEDTTSPDYQFSSGTHTNTGSITFAGDTSNWGKDCYEIGILLGLDKADYDSEKNAFLDYIDTEYEYYDYVAFDDVFWLSGDAEYINKGTIIFQGEEGKYQPDDSNYIIEAVSCAIISGNAKFVNEGTVNYSDSEEYSALFLTDSATFENTESGVFYHLDAYLAGNSSFVNNGYVGLLEVETYGSSSFVNNGNISWDKDLSLHGSSSFVNNADATITNFRYAYIHGNASFENNGKISLSDFYSTITFLAYEDGDASFVNNGSIGDDTTIEICTSLDTDKGEKEEISTSSTGTFENNGEITAGELNVTLEVYIYAETSDSAHQIFENLNTTGRAFFENYGTITAGEVVIDSFVETTLAQGSKIDGNLTLGNASYYYYGSYYLSNGIEGMFVADKSVLNIVLNGDSETPLISGDLTLLNSTELNVSVDPNSETAEIYTVTLWSGGLVYGEQTIYSYEDGQYTKETIMGSFVETSGTFVVGDETFNWVLDTSTGVLTAKSENIEEEVVITDPNQSVSLGKNDVAIFETDSFEGTISGSGGVYSGSNLSFSGDASEHTGTTYVQGGTFTVEEGAQLGSGSYEISSDAVLEIASDREFTNATSGNGTLSIASGAEVSFTKNVGVRVIYVKDGATLKSGVTLTHSDTLLILAGELSLNASAGEQVSFTNGGTVTIEGTATLNLSSGVAPASVRTLSNSSGLGAGSNVTIFSGATVEGDVAGFLATDSTLSDLAYDYAVVYDTSKGLSITILESGNVSSISSGLKLHDGLGSDFVSAVISADDLDFGTGIKSSDELQSLSNPIVMAIATGNLSEAAAMFDTLSPLAYAAMVAMPTTSFYNDVKAIDNRLAARRGKLDENARWEFFAQAQGTFIENDDADDTQAFDFDLYGVLAGADYRVNEGLTVGLTVGYDYGKADIHNSGGKIESDDVRVTIFAGQQIGEMFFVNAGAQVGYGHYEAKRKTAYGNANGDTDGWNAGVFADARMMLTLSKELRISARPYVGIAYMHSEVGSFDDGLLDVDDFHGDSLRASIGCGVFWGFDLAETVCSVGLDASYSHDFCGDEVDIDGKFMSTNKGFGTTAKALSENLFSVGPVVSVAISESVGVFASYAFEAGTDSSTGHSVNAGVSVSF